jgi:hypothetical protein
MRDRTGFGGFFSSSAEKSVLPLINQHPPALEPPGQFRDPLFIGIPCDQSCAGLLTRLHSETMAAASHNGIQNEKTVHERRQACTFLMKWLNWQRRYLLHDVRQSLKHGLGLCQIGNTNLHKWARVERVLIVGWVDTGSNSKIIGSKSRSLK